MYCFKMMGLLRGLRNSLAAILVCLSGLMLFGQSANADYADAIALLRGGNGHQADFRRAERLLRTCAWQDNDVLCQHALGQLYETGLYPEVGDAFARREVDNVEALVWYYLAMLNLRINGESYPGGANLTNIAAKVDEGCVGVLEDFIGRSYGASWKIWSAKRRIVYILRSQGASGRYLLGLIRSDGPGKIGLKRGLSRNRCFSLLWIDNNQARVNFQVADSLGHPFAQQAILDLETEMRKKGIKRTRAQIPTPRHGHHDRVYIYPPFSLDPVKNANALTKSQVPPKYLSDESLKLPEHEIEIASLQRMDSSVHQQLASAALGEIYGKMPNAVKSFKKDVGLPITSSLSAWEIVLALKLAAHGGGAKSSNFLGEMYFQGLGVPKNLIVSKHLFESASFGDAAFDPERFDQPHSVQHLALIVDLLKGENPPSTNTINATAVKNICLLMGNDKVFPASKLKAQSYLEILTIMGPKYASQRNACRALIN
jgi:TPR repeat protein